MANVTAAYAIAVRADLDATGVATGAEMAEASMRELAASADLAAQDIDTALATDVPASVDSSTVQLTTKAGKFKAVGTELGTNLASGIAGGASAPEAALSTGSAMTQLLAASAKTAKGAFALVGLGVGVAFVTNLIQGMQARKAEAIAAYNDLFSKIEVNAEDSMQKVRRSIFEAFDFQAAVTELGGGDINAGFAKIQTLMEGTALSASDIALVLQRGVTPNTREWASQIRQILKDGRSATGEFGRGAKVYTEQAEIAKEILATGHENEETQRRLVEQKEIELEVTRRLATETKHGRDELDAMAAAAERTARALNSINITTGRGLDAS